MMIIIIMLMLMMMVATPGRVRALIRVLSRRPPPGAAGQGDPPGPPGHLRPKTSRTRSLGRSAQEVPGAAPQPGPDPGWVLQNVHLRIYYYTVLLRHPAPGTRHPETQTWEKALELRARLDPGPRGGRCHSKHNLNKSLGIARASGSQPARRPPKKTHPKKSLGIACAFGSQPARRWKHPLQSIGIACAFGSLRTLSRILGAEGVQDSRGGGGQRNIFPIHFPAFAPF